MSFSEKLKTFRNSCGLTQADIAEQLHISRQAISKWENGLNEPDIMSIIQLCDILEVSLDELLRDDLLLVQKLAQKERSFKKLIVAIAILGLVIILLLCMVSFDLIQR
jgi:transcriptional regulator with XRE-family HTH domain